MLIGAPLHSGAMGATGVAPAEDLSLKQDQPMVPSEGAREGPGIVSHVTPLNKVRIPLTHIGDSRVIQGTEFYDQLTKDHSDPSHTNLSFIHSHWLPGNDSGFAKGQSQKGI